MASKATRSQHYLNIAEFYGRMLVEDMRDPKIPEFVLAHSARRTAHFALVGMRLAERRRTVRPSWPAVGSAGAAVGAGAISSASLS